MQAFPLFVLEFEMECQWVILTRINSLLFRKRIYPLAMKIDFNEKINAYKVKMSVRCELLYVSILARQIERLVGVSNMKIEKGEK